MRDETPALLSHTRSYTSHTSPQHQRSRCKGWAIETDDESIQPLASDGQPFEAEYDLAETLGEGAMSVVRAAVLRRTGERFAVKCIAKQNLNLDDEAALLQEVSVMQRVDHPNIVKLHAFYDEPTMFYLVLDLINGGELFDRISTKEFYSESEARALITILLKTVAYCHSNKIVHRDLKPENLLCVSKDDDTTIKLCDFGFAAMLTEEKNSLTQLLGTPGYVAPEILRRQPYGAAVDMWSVGVITYILLGGYQPFFEEDDNEKLYEKIRYADYEFHDTYWSDISEKAKDFIRSLLNVDPEQRATAAELLTTSSWILDEKPATLHLAKQQHKLRDRCRFKAAATAVMATRRLRVAANVGSTRRRNSATIQEGSFLEEFAFGGDLGAGALSAVREVVSRKTNCRFACKCIKKKRLNVEDEEMLLIEARIMQQLSHPNIVKLYAMYQENGSYYMVMDLIKGGELFNRIVQKECYSEKEARDLVKTILDVVRYLHVEAMMAHRDIKPENLLCVSHEDDSQIKLCDFGFAARLDPRSPQNCLSKMCGTPGYVAPEILNRVKYGPAVDMWSCGVLMYIILGGYPPFYDKDQKKLYSKIKAGSFEFHPAFWDHISADAKNLITRLICVDPHQRMTAQAALDHPWIAKTPGEDLAKISLNGNLKALKKFDARRKFIGAGKALIAARRMSLAASIPISMSSTPTPIMKRSPSNMRLKNKGSALLSPSSSSSSIQGGAAPQSSKKTTNNNAPAAPAVAD